MSKSFPKHASAISFSNQRARSGCGVGKLPNPWSVITTP
jgi:hypothetical protein